MFCYYATWIFFELCASINTIAAYQVKIMAEGCGHIKFTFNGHGHGVIFKCTYSNLLFPDSWLTEHGHGILWDDHGVL